MYGLGHMDITPIVYGVIIFLGLLSIFYKLIKEKFLSLFIEISVFILVFQLHGGSMEGGFAATVASLLAGLIFPLFIKKSKEDV